jgi:hypothetical protein
MDNTKGFIREALVLIVAAVLMIEFFAVFDSSSDLSRRKDPNWAFTHLR